MPRIAPPDLLPEVTRVQDLRKVGVHWDSWDPPVHVFSDGKRIIDLQTPQDLVQLGTIQHHCTGSVYHFHWVCTVPITKFLVLCDDTGTPSVAAHIKRKVWMGKDHPAVALDKSLDKYDTYKDGYYTRLKTLGGGTAYENWGAGTNPVRAAEAALTRARKGYENAREEALRYGPLGPNHPLKWLVDRTNKEVTTCVGYLERAKRGNLFPIGSCFSYGRKIWAVIGYSGRGMDDPYHAQEYFTEWVRSTHAYRGILAREERY